MRRQNQVLGLKFVGAMLVALFLLTTWFIQPVTGVTPPAQDGRPTLPPLPPRDPSGGGTDGDGEAAEVNCAGLRGKVINWGFKNEPGITLRLGDGGWETVQVTSADGSYQFGPLGQGVAFLTVDLSQKQAEALRPMADNVAVRLRCDFDVVANLGLYSSPARPDPPATLTMGVSKVALLPGESVTFYLRLKNDMPHSISHVFVTDYLPDGLTVVEVTTTRGTPEVLDGRMVTVYVGELPQGAQETIQIVAQAEPTLAYGLRLKNSASLLYAESAADQAWAFLTVGSMESVIAPTSTPVLSPSPAEVVTPTLSPTPSVPVGETPAPPLLTPAVDQTPGPEDELLPVTGGGTTMAVLSIGLVLVLGLLGVHRLRVRSAEK